MFCNQCGARLQPGVAFCTHCGKAVGAPGTPTAAVASPVLSAATGRVTKHRNILGILWVIAGVLSFPGALVLMGLSSMQFGHYYGGWSGPFGPDSPHFLVPLFGFFGAGLLIFAIISIATGVGLLTAQPWARMLAIILGIIRLISIPFGTALGIYTLWVLLPEQSNQEYAQLAQPHART